MSEEKIPPYAYPKVRISPRSLERLRDAVAGVNARQRYTLREALERAIDLLVVELEVEFNAGVEFPQRAVDLPRGRPRKSGSPAVFPRVGSVADRDSESRS